MLTFFNTLNDDFDSILLNLLTNIGNFLFCDKKCSLIYTGASLFFTLTKTTEVLIEQKIKNFIKNSFLKAFTFIKTKRD